MAASFSLFRHSSVGDLLGYAFRLYRARFGIFVLTAAVFYIPWTVISVLFTGAFTTGPLSGPYGEPSLGILQSLTVGAFVTLALTVQSIEALHSRSLTVGEGIRRGLSRFWPYVVIVTVTTVPSFVCMSPLILIPLLYLSLRWFVATAALIAEERGPLDSLRRSWRLSRGNVLRIFGYFILLSIIAGLVNILPAYLLEQIVPALLPTSAPGLGAGIFAAVSSLLYIISAPFLAGALVLFYYDLRVRGESYDLELRIAEMEEQVSRSTDQDMP